MEIKAEELKAILEQLLEYQKELGRESFSLSYDYYWDIVKEQKYNSYNEPSLFTLGQLSWDLEHLQDTLREKRDPTNLHFVWLGQLLIAIGETMTKSADKAGE
jgi:hypothetical protein